MPVPDYPVASARPWQVELPILPGLISSNPAGNLLHLTKVLLQQPTLTLHTILGLAVKLISQRVSGYLWYSLPFFLFKNCSAPVVVPFNSAKALAYPQ